MTTSSSSSRRISWTAMYGNPGTTHSRVPESRPFLPIPGKRPRRSTLSSIRDTTRSAARGLSNAIQSNIWCRSSTRLLIEDDPHRLRDAKRARTSPSETYVRSLAFLRRRISARCSSEIRRSRSPSRYSSNAPAAASCSSSGRSRTRAMVWSRSLVMMRAYHKSQAASCPASAFAISARVSGMP